MPDTQNAVQVENYADLKSFLASYFHQDWDLEANNADDCLTIFLSHDPSDERLGKIISQIHAYIANEGDVDSIGRGLTRTLGCFYLPAGEGMTARNWLVHVGDVLAKGMKQR